MGIIQTSPIPLSREKEKKEEEKRKDTSQCEFECFWLDLTGVYVTSQGIVRPILLSTKNSHSP